MEVPSSAPETSGLSNERADVLANPAFHFDIKTGFSRHIKGLTEQQVREHLDSFIDLWSELFPAEQARIIQLLVARVEIGTAGADITLRTEGLTSLIRDIGFKENQDCAA